MRRRGWTLVLLVLTVVGAASAAARYSTGDRVMIKYGAAWVPATVTGVRGDLVYRVRYDNNGGEWNTLAQYLQPEAGFWRGGPVPVATPATEPTLGERVRSQYQGAWYAGQIVDKRPGWVYRVLCDGTTADFETLSDYMYLVGRSWWSPGDAVMVQWNGSWYRAYIVRVTGPDSFLIHYDGYGSDQDEVVTSDRIRPIGILD